jgi:hypothetical protein
MTQWTLNFFPYGSDLIRSDSGLQESHVFSPDHRGKNVTSDLVDT